MKQATLTGIIGIVILGCMAVIGSAFYTKVLPKLQEPPAPPKPKPPTVALYPTDPTIKTSIPWVSALPHTTVVHLAHQTANAHQAWGLANMGKMTDPGSLFARHGLTVRFFRREAVEDRIKALAIMAKAFHRGDLDQLLVGDTSSTFRGAHFFTVGGDASSWVVGQTNRELQRINPAYQAEIIGFAGLSAGENQFLGPSEWRRDPQQALGRAVIGVPYDSAWSVLVLWCAQHDLPLNTDQAYYNPKALNFIQAGTPAQAAKKYLEAETFERIFLADGEDSRGRKVKTGEKRRIGLHGVVTQTPFDQQIATEQRDVVTIASTKHFPNQTPQFLVGLKQWNAENHDTVVNLLAALFEASRQIEHSDRELKAKRIDPKSESDLRWQAARYAYEIFDAASPDAWYGYYHAADTKAERSPEVDIGGASVADLQQNLLFFGLGQSGPDRGEIVYSRFAQLANQYELEWVEDYPEWPTVFSGAYLKSVLERFPSLAKADSEQPTYLVEIKKELPQPQPPPKPKPSTYNLFFELSQDSLTGQHESLLQQAVDQIVSIGKVKLEIHGYTDTTGHPEYNRELAHRRSVAVYNWLKDALGTYYLANVELIGHGEEELYVDDEFQGEQTLEELMAQSRRVVLRIIPL